MHTDRTLQTGEPFEAPAIKRTSCSLARTSEGPPQHDPLLEGADEDMAIESCPLADVLEERFRFERLLFDVSAAFVNLPLQEIDAQIQRSLQRLGSYLNVDRSSFA